MSRNLMTEFSCAAEELLIRIYVRESEFMYGTSILANCAFNVTFEESNMDQNVSFMTLESKGKKGMGKY
jgi:hypothetical protein